MEPAGDSLEEHPLETVLLEGGTVNLEYQCMCLESAVQAWTEQQLVEVVPVGFVQGKLLVAAPLGAWHRTVAKRVLPARALSKAVVVEVGLRSPFQREAAEPEEVVRLWMGFLAETYVGALRPIAEMDEIGLAFAEGEFTSYLPLADGMREAAQEHFAFESATEGIPRSSTSMRTRADDVGSPALSSEHRMTRIRDDGEVGRTGRHDDSPSAFTKFACHTYSAFGLEKERGDSGFSRCCLEVPQPGPWRCVSSSQCRCGGRCPCADAEADAGRPEEAEETSRSRKLSLPPWFDSQCNCPYWFVRVDTGGRRGRACRRFWVGTAYRRVANSTRSDQVGRDYVGACSRQDEEGQGLSRSCSGWDILTWGRREWKPWLREASCCCPEGSPDSFAREPIRDPSTPGACHARGSDQPDSGPGAACPSSVQSGLDRTSVSHWSLEDSSLYSMDSWWCLGLSDQRRCCWWPRSSMSAPADARPDCLRSRQLDVVLRALARIKPSNGSLRTAPTPGRGGGRAALFPSSRSSLGGGCHIRDTEDFMSRRLKLGKKDQSEVDGDPSKSKPKAKGKAAEKSSPALTDQ